MTQNPLTVGGIPIPTDSPTFLAVLAVHVIAGLCSTITGIAAMLSRKGQGRHPQWGTLYYRCLTVVSLTMGVLAAMRWAEDYHLFFLGVLSYSAAVVARKAARSRRAGWVRLHITGMGASYILMLPASYVDNGKNLAVWRDLPAWTYWLLPSAVGIPLIFRALLRNPLAVAERRNAKSGMP